MGCLICTKYKKEKCLNRSICHLFKDILVSANVPPRYQNLLVTDLEYKKKVFQDYVNTFNHFFVNNDLEIRSLYIYSKATGTGKTTSAIALLNEFAINFFLNCYKHKLTPPNNIAYFLDSNELQTLYNNFNRSGVSEEVADKASKEYYHRLEKANEAEMVVIDDLGVRSATEGFRSDLHQLINARVVNGLPCIYTSNYPMDKMEMVYDKRLHDRVRNNTVTISFDELTKSKRGVDINV